MESVVIVVVVVVVAVAAIRWFTGVFKKQSQDTPSGPAVPHKAPARLPQLSRLPLAPSAKPTRRRDGRLRVLVRRWLTREDTSQQRRTQISWHGTIIAGKARVTDGDGIKVSGHTIRLAGLDAPEWDQKAKNKDGYWYNEGLRAKSELNGRIGGKPVEVQVYNTDKYGRLVGTVLYEDKDVGEWLVRQGYAIAAYGDQYKHAEAEARRAQRGRWGDAVVYDPRAWHWFWRWTRR